MKLHGDRMYERRHGSVLLQWHFRSWGIGLHGGAYFDDWMVFGIDECYWVAWVKFSLGPFDLEFSYYGPGRKWPQEEEKWVSLYELREGAIFETKDGTKSMKTAYPRPGGEYECYRLADGRRIYFGVGDLELVRELSEEEWEG